jgi:hypothetical protein
MPSGGPGRGQGRKPLAHKTKGLRVWVPVTNAAEAASINGLSAAERRQRLLGEGASPVYTFRYDDLNLDNLSATDLRQEAADALGNGDTVAAYRISIYKDDRPDPQGAQALYIKTEGRVGIAWGAEAQWMDSTGDIEQDIDMWLNDPDQFEARN